MSSIPYIVKDIRDIGEVPTYIIESLRSLIKDVGMFIDLVNVVENTFEIPLIQMELSISLLLSLNLTLHMIQKRINCT